MLSHVKLQLLGWLTEQSAPQGQQAEQVPTGNDARPGHVREQLLQLPHELLRLARSLSGSSSTAVLNGSSNSRTSNTAALQHSPGPAPDTTVQGPGDDQGSSTQAVLQAVHSVSHQSTQKAGVSSQSTPSQQQLSHESEGATATCHEAPQTPANVQPQTPLQGAWAARSHAVWGSVSNTKQQALAQRLRGTPPSQQKSSSKQHASLLSAASPSSGTASTPHLTSSKAAPCTPSSEGQPGGIRVLRISTPSQPHTPLSAQAAACSRLQVTPVSASASADIVTEARQKLQEVCTPASAQTTQEGSERTPASNGNSKAPRRQSKTARRVAPTAVSPSNHTLNAATAPSQPAALSEPLASTCMLQGTGTMQASGAITSSKGGAVACQQSLQTEHQQPEAKQSVYGPAASALEATSATCSQEFSVASSIRTPQHGCVSGPDPSTPSQASLHAASVSDPNSTQSCGVGGGEQPALQVSKQADGTVGHTCTWMHWTPWHAAAAELHGSLLLRGFFHESTVDDVTCLITLLITPCPSTGCSRQQSITSPFAPQDTNSDTSRQLNSSNKDPGGALADSAAQQTSLAFGIQQVLACLQSLLPTQGQQVPWPLAQRYAGTVLDQCSQLVCSLGAQVRELLLACQVVRAACPRLACALDEQQRRSQVQQLQPQQQQPTLTLQGVRATWASSTQARHNGLPMAGQPVNPEQARMQANRERCRDAFHALAKDASALAAALSEPGTSTIVLQELRISGTGRNHNTQRGGNGSAAAALAQALIGLQRRVQGLLAVLHPHNLVFLADLYTSSILQAAATGEAVMDAAVASLAQQDPSRFARLSARLQSTGAAGAPTPVPVVATRAPRVLPQKGHAAQHAGASQRPQPLANQPSANRQSSGLHNNNSSSNTAQHDFGGGGVHVELGKEEVFAATERLACSMQLLEDFAPVQRGYVLLCDLADSRAFVNAVGRCMAERLTSGIASLPGWTAVQQNGQAPGSGLKATASDGQLKGVTKHDAQAPWAALNTAQQRLLHEQLTTCCTLANYLSYLTHAHHPDSRDVHTAWQGGSVHIDVLSQQVGQDAKPVAIHWPAPTFCTAQLLQSAVRAGILPVVMPCVVHLLWHSHLDLAALLRSQGGVPQGMPATPVHAALCMLCMLRQHPELQPVTTNQGRGFGAAALATRSLMDDLQLRVATALGCSLQQLPHVLGCEGPTNSCASASASQSPGSNTADLCTQGQQQTTNTEQAVGIEQGHVEGGEQLQAGNQQASVSGASTALAAGKQQTSGLGAVISSTVAAVGGTQASDLGAHTVPAAGDQQETGVRAADSSAAATAVAGVKPQLGIAVWNHVADPCLLRLCCPGFDTCCRRLRRVLTGQPNQQIGISRTASATIASNINRPMPSKSATMGTQPPDGNAAASPIPLARVQSIELASVGDSGLPELEMCGSMLTGMPACGMSVGSAASSSQCSPARGMSQGASMGGRPTRTIAPRKVSAVRVHGWNPRAALALLPPAALLPPGLASLLQTQGNTHYRAAGGQTSNTDNTSMAVDAANGGGIDSQLQQVLLAQYSGDEQPVKLKEVCNMVSEISSANTVSNVLGELLLPALTAGLQSLHDLAAKAAAEAIQASAVAAAAVARREQAKQAAASVLSLAAPSSSGQHTATQCPSGALQLCSKQPVGLTQKTLSLRDRLSQTDVPRTPITCPQASAQVFSPLELNSCISNLVPAVDSMATTTIKQVLADAEPLCRAQLASRMGGALVALLPAAWPPAVLQAASAVAQQQALTSCAHRLVQQVPPLVLSQLHQHVEGAAKQALKQAKLGNSSGAVLHTSVQGDGIPSQSGTIATHAGAILAQGGDRPAQDHGVPIQQQVPAVPVTDQMLHAAVSQHSAQMHQADGVHVAKSDVRSEQQQGLAAEAAVDAEEPTSASLGSRCGRCDSPAWAHEAGSGEGEGTGTEALLGKPEECDGLAHVMISPSGKAVKDGTATEEVGAPSVKQLLKAPYNAVRDETGMEGDLASKQRSIGQQVAGCLQSWLATCSSAADTTAQQAAGATNGGHNGNMQSQTGPAVFSQDCCSTSNSDTGFHSQQAVLQQLGNYWAHHKQQPGTQSRPLQQQHQHQQGSSILAQQSKDAAMMNIRQQASSVGMMLSEQALEQTSQQVSQQASVQTSQQASAQVTVQLSQQAAKVGADVAHLLLAAAGSTHQAHSTPANVSSMLSCMADLMNAAVHTLAASKPQQHGNAAGTKEDCSSLEQAHVSDGTCVGVQHHVASMLGHCVLHIWTRLIQQHSEQLDPWGQSARTWSALRPASSMTDMQPHARGQQHVVMAGTEHEQQRARAWDVIPGGLCEGELMGCLLQLPAQLIAAASELGSWALMHEVRTSLQRVSMAQVGLGPDCSSSGSL